MIENNSKQKYKTILADPPWDINQTGKRGAESHYNLMTLDAIKKMPVADLCDENAHLWLWVTNGLLQEGLDVMKAWGFTFRSPFYWIKPRLGLGNYIRNASETLLFGTRGKAPIQFKAQPNWLFAPLQDHSHIRARKLTAKFGIRYNLIYLEIRVELHVLFLLKIRQIISF